MRRLDHVLHDPVLRRWLVGRAFRRMGGGSVRPRRPPYLGAPPPTGKDSSDARPFGEITAESWSGARPMVLPGLNATLDPSNASRIFDQEFSDLEQHLALQRFVWLPAEGRDADAAFVQRMWIAWRERHAHAKDGWAWHPYTTGERALNLVRFARRVGLPAPAGETLEILREHARWIRLNLEYFGDRGTGNHLANNARALFILGLELGLPAHADDGATVLREEAARLFLPSGMLREGSSHYHLLVTRFYLDCWLAALRFGRSEARWLKAICARALGAAAALRMPARFPLIGDISPDCTPEFLAPLSDRELRSEGWIAGFGQEDHRHLASLLRTVSPPAYEALAHDGWIRLDQGAWAFLLYASPQGWPFVPGHAHQDFGGFEAHWGSTLVFADLGRGWYGEGGRELEYWSARAHNTLLVDGNDPYPVNRPYYDDTFRHAVAGGRPRISLGEGSVVLSHDGFSRFKGVGTLVRTVRPESDGFAVHDELGGMGARTITRLLHSPLIVRREADAVMIEGDGQCWRVRADGEIALRPTTLWTAYGRGQPATTIEIRTRSRLPWAGTIDVRRS